MTTHTEDFRVSAARTHLEHAGKPDELPQSLLVKETYELRRLLAWLLDVADDFMNTDPDEDITQVLNDGAVLVAPADVHRLPADLIMGLRLSSLHS
jgi:hypothetical protein